ncbi:isopeptide-forming domain-containing fimbrial protein [Carnobacterium divergens]|uniref:Isopeptide-forming domain-containing fimbrial protein n=1 Tax=Carnobacterium divergens TaxID=2748 RepID=A0AAW8R8Y6_CARDV|nr:isopeptide-forming domain-containing fimbrial protein [Carnobacterium divergens]MDT1956823.1 isopeptide-forming domain-containing fimbrial protein [Carnobacterium divergens]MDT1972793.1 isopeptide-forming domain-containing fimbrial protein [Carnobacterium divergens]
MIRMSERSKKEQKSLSKRLLFISLLSFLSVSSIQKVRAIELNSVNEENQNYEKIGKTTIEKNIENQQVIKITDPDQLVKWNVIVNFGYPLPENESIKIVDQLDANLNIEKVEIHNQDGQSVIDNGTLSIENNKLVFDLKKKGGSYDYLENQSYTITIFTKVN